MSHGQRYTKANVIALVIGFSAGLGLIIGGVVMVTTGKQKEDDVLAVVTNSHYKGGYDYFKVDVKYNDANGKLYEKTVLLPREKSEIKPGDSVRLYYSDINNPHEGERGDSARRIGGFTMIAIGSIIIFWMFVFWGDVHKKEDKK